MKPKPLLFPAPREVLWGKCISNLFSRKKKGKGGEGVLEFIIFLKEKKGRERMLTAEGGLSSFFLGGRGGVDGLAAWMPFFKPK